MKNKWILCLMALGLSGCATILSGTSQTIHVKSIDSVSKETLTDVRCSVTDGSGGGSTIMTNPGSTKVSRARGSVVVNCSKPGYRQLNTSVGDNFNAVTLVNILFWPGFIVDAASGSYRKYPSHYLVSMEKIPTPEKKILKKTKKK